MDTTGANILYACPLDLSGGGLVGEKSSLPDDIDVSILITEELSDSVSAYYSKLWPMGKRIWRRALEHRDRWR